MSKNIINPDDVFAELETSRLTGELATQVTSAPFYFEASVIRPGFLDRVDAQTGERQAGQFRNGKWCST